MTHVSLFSGAGISDWGFHQAGWQCLAQVEIDKQATSVRKVHFPDCEHHDDIRSFDAKQFRGVDAIIGGFPCQDYSVAGKRAGLAGDRGALWWEFHRCIREAMPGLVIAENVPGLLSSDEGRSFRTILGSLVELGYGVCWRILDLRYFRVPQRRRRVFIVASLGDGRSAEILFEPDCLRGDSPKGTEAGEEVAGTLGGGSGVRGWRNDLDSSGAYVPTCIKGAAIGRQPQNGPQRGEVLEDSCYSLNTREIHAVGTIAGSGAGTSRPAGNANETDLIIPFAQNSRDEVRDLRDCAGALCADAGVKQQTYVAFNANASAASSPSFDSTSPTLDVGKAGRVSTSNGMAVRRLTPREAERLMGLPDDFTRYGHDGKEIADGPRYRMLGNGWSVPQARWLAERALFSYESMREAA